MALIILVAMQQLIPEFLGPAILVLIGLGVVYKAVTE